MQNSVVMNTTVCIGRKGMQCRWVIHYHHLKKSCSTPVTQNALPGRRHLKNRGTLNEGGKDYSVRERKVMQFQSERLQVQHTTAQSAHWNTKLPVQLCLPIIHEKKCKVDISEFCRIVVYEILGHYLLCSLVQCFHGKMF